MMRIELYVNQTIHNFGCERAKVVEYIAGGATREVAQLQRSTQHSMEI